MKTITLTAASALLAFSAAGASAASVIALTGDDALVTIDTATNSVTGSTFVSGIDGRVLGIDVRPADGMLYALFADGTVATVDPASGAATAVDTLTTIPPGEATVTVDFNPVANAMRIMGSEGTSLRTKFEGGAVTEDGRHAFAAGDMHEGETPMVIAGAYTNSRAGAEATTLYTIDGTLDALLKQDPPNDGTLSAIGLTGVTLDDAVAFDIMSDAAGGNEAWLLSSGTLYTVDLESGAATEVAAISGLDGPVRDMAILPAM